MKRDIARVTGCAEVERCFGVCIQSPSTTTPSHCAIERWFVNPNCGSRTARAKSYTTRVKSTRSTGKSFTTSAEWRAPIARAGVDLQPGVDLMPLAEPRTVDLDLPEMRMASRHGSAAPNSR
jgi:hypothetical protein